MSIWHYVLGKLPIDYVVSDLMPLIDLKASLSVAKWVWVFMMDYKDVIASNNRW